MFFISINIFKQQFVFHIGHTMVIAVLRRINGKEIFLIKKPKCFKASFCYGTDQTFIKIIGNYNPTRIYQWGSLLKQRHFCGISDIDIAVEGIGSAERYFRMIGESAELTDFLLDCAGGNHH